MGYVDPIGSQTLAEGHQCQMKSKAETSTKEPTFYAEAIA